MDVVVRNPLTLREGVSQSRAVLFLLIYPSRRTRGSSSQHSSLSLSISRRKEAKGQGQRRGKGQTTSSSFLSPLHPTRPPPPHPPADWCSAVQRSAGVVLLCYGCLLMSPVLFSLYTPQERTDGEFLAFFFLLRLLRIFDSTVRGGKKGKGKEQKYPPRICTHYHCPFCRARLQLHHII